MQRRLDAMQGDSRTRFCGTCAKNVYNLSEMSRAQAQALVNEKEGKMCVQFYQRADGTMLTDDCPVVLRPARNGALRVWRTAAAATLTLAALCAGWMARAGDAAPKSSAHPHHSGKFTKHILKKRAVVKASGRKQQAVPGQMIAGGIGPAPAPSPTPVTPPVVLHPDDAPGGAEFRVKGEAAWKPEPPAVIQVPATEPAPRLWRGDMGTSLRGKISVREPLPVPTPMPTATPGPEPEPTSTPTPTSTPSPE